MPRIIGIVFGFFVVSSLGCGASLQDLRKRAAFDLHCPEGSVEIVELGNHTRGVRGCGKEATYLETCRDTSGYTDDCLWALNSKVN